MSVHFNDNYKGIQPFQNKDSNETLIEDANKKHRELTDKLNRIENILLDIQDSINR